MLEILIKTLIFLSDFWFIPLIALALLSENFDRTASFLMESFKMPLKIMLDTLTAIPKMIMSCVKYFSDQIAKSAKQDYEHNCELFNAIMFITDDYIDSESKRMSSESDANLTTPQISKSEDGLMDAFMNGNVKADEYEIEEFVKSISRYFNNPQGSTIIHTFKPKNQEEWLCDLPSIELGLIGEIIVVKDKSCKYFGMVSAISRIDTYPGRTLYEIEDAPNGYPFMKKDLAYAAKGWPGFGRWKKG